MPLGLPLKGPLKPNLTRIHELCLERGWTWQTLADRASVSPRTIDEMVKGKHKLYLCTINKFVRAFNAASPQPIVKGGDYTPVPPVTPMDLVDQEEALDQRKKTYVAERSFYDVVAELAADRIRWLGEINTDEDSLEIWVKLGLPKSSQDFSEATDLTTIITHLQQLLGEHIRVLGVIGNSVTVLINAATPDLITLVTRWDEALPSPHQPLVELYCRPLPVPPYTLMPILIKYLQSQELMHLFKLTPAEHGSFTIAKVVRIPEPSKETVPAQS
jgi:hypothetical protein